MNIWQSYKQERDCFVHFLHLLEMCCASAKVHETIMFLFVTFTDLKFFFTHRLSNKPFLIWLLTSPPQLKYVVTLPCNLSLMACFADIDVSQGSVATCARCGGIFNIHLTANLPRNLPVKFFFKSVKNWQNYGHESVAPFFGPPCIWRLFVINYCLTSFTVPFFPINKQWWLEDKREDYQNCPKFPVQVYSMYLTAVHKDMHTHEQFLPLAAALGLNFAKGCR